MTQPATHTTLKLRRALRALLVGPQLAAFVPALALGLYWYGGEALLLVFAAVFPALLLALGLVSTPRGSNAWTIDQLTGLPLRDTMLRQLDYGFSGEAEGGPRPAMVLEIDDWSEVRNRHGAGTAETILRRVADRLRAALRPEDLVARLGDGRFGLVLKGGRRVDLESMVQVASRIQGAVSEPIPIDALRIHLTSSVGFCLPSRAPDTTGESALNAAETALGQAQLAGPGSIRAFSRKNRLPSVESDISTREVLAALETGVIVPWFQPQVSTDTGEVSGFEALARWQHPDRGQISPATFLPVIARAGLLERLGETMLFNSLSALRDWDRAGLGIRHVSVNLSGDELRNPRLAERIKWEVDRFDLAPERLVLEVLEDVFADTGDDAIVANLRALSEAGFKLDLDDFGTGHASITNVRRFNVHMMKIDRSFVTRIDVDRDQQNMVSAILTMAERLGVETIAEGVETQGEHAMLAQLGCRYVQGFGIAPPMPLSAVRDWIADHRKAMPPGPAIAKNA